MRKYTKLPIFKRGEVVTYFNSLPNSEKKIINNFINYVSIESSSKARLDNNRRTITQLRYITNKKLDNIDLEDLRHYLALLKKSDKTVSTQTDYKASIKRFLRWHFHDWSSRFDDLKDIKLKFGHNEEKINASTIPKKNEIELLVKEEPHLYWKTFFINFYESGVRPGELRKIRWSKIELGAVGELSALNIFATKTSKARTAYVKEGTFYLLELQKQQIKDKIYKPDGLVFPSPRNENKLMDKGRVSEWLKKLTLRVLNRTITPYMFRHARATELYTNAKIPDKIVQKFLGHGKNMSDIYTHLSSSDVKEALGKTVYQFENLPPEEKRNIEKRLDKSEKENKLIRKELDYIKEKLKHVLELTKRLD